MVLREKWQHLGFAVFNVVVTHVPLHHLRLATLRMWGAKIGHGASVGRGTSVLDIHSLRIGEDCSIGFRCMLDARGGIVIGDNVVLASDTHIITGRHDVNADDFAASFHPVRIGDFAWVASRSTVIDGVTIGRGAVVGACSLVKDDVAEMTVVAGVPAKVRGKRDSALKYSARYRRSFY